MARGANQVRHRSSGLLFKSVIAGLLFVAGLVLGASGRATITAPPDCEVPASAGVILGG